MRRREHYWSLYHLPERNQLDDLRTDQVEAIFAAIPPKTYSEWMIWKEGYEGWKPLRDFPQLLLALRHVKEDREAPPAPVREPIVSIAPSPQEVETGTSLALDEESANDDRGTTRYPKKYEVLIFATDRVIKSTTLDVSLEGMRIQDALPNDLPRYFNVEMRVGERVIPVICSLVRTLDGTPSRRLKIEVNDHVNVLHTLLLAS